MAAALQMVGWLPSLSSTADITSLQPRLRSHLAQSPRISLHFRKRWACSPTRMGLKVVHTYDSSFELKPECEEKLHSLLNSATFRTQLAGELSQQQSGASTSSSEYEFTGELFQPVPWSITTRHGMPQEFEKYTGNADYAIVNVPPNFMFQAKIFKPSRLCAIFRKVVKAESDV